MTKTHFEAIARIIRDNEAIGSGDCAFGHNWARREIANEMADYFQSENPRFDRQKFLTACGF